MKEPEKLIVLERTDYSNNMHIKTINIHDNVMPYKETFVKNPDTQKEYDRLNKMFQFGNSVDYFPETKTWRLDYEYNDPSHGYDIVVVLSVLSDELLYVYGNKTPRTKIEYNPSLLKYKGIQRGDWLLLEKIYSHPYVVHNITQEQLVFEMNQFNPKTR